jgi:hypothetical protein
VGLDQARGPAWLGADYDPEYMYLLNALNLVELEAPAHYDHPGTPLQLVGAAVIWILHRLTGTPAATFRGAVLGDPEFFLTGIAVALLGAFALATAVLGWTALRATRSLGWAVGAQLAPFLLLATLRTLGRVTPEAALLPVATALAAATLATLTRADSPRHARDPLLLGALAGLGVATKVTFLPVTLVALAAVRGVRPRLLMAAAALATFGLATLPVLRHAGAALRWFTSVALRAGVYGEGAPTVIDPRAFPAAVRDLILAEPVFAAFVTVTVGVLIVRPRGSGKTVSSVLAAVAAADVLQLALAGKGFGGTRYLVPAGALAGLNVCLLVTVTGAIRSPRVRGVLAALIVAGSIGGLGVQLARTIDLRRSLVARQAGQRHLLEAARSVPDALVVPLYGAPSPAVGLFFANFFAGGRYTRELDALFAGVLLSTGAAGEPRVRTDGRTFLRLGEGRVPTERVEDWARDRRLLFLGPRELLPPAFRYEAPPGAPDPLTPDDLGLFRAGAPATSRRAP